ncbi:PepSY domain-containing protein [Paucibacter sp. Y2R2-4]|uniref:PepSY domain-containing protein n=1 Tax=Paucibacter sp. Y2R2-4 TaxID=2893553 RepID=UPI0021E4A07B|nr:PepSY domain-containing protein [Paucibacter sp. Y2R2-4]MCV2350569.1 PepSY domain-containing protein [Paucibacter sp. Y2R2-4]
MSKAMRWSPFLFRWHRWLGYVVALQVLAWIVGGLLFAWMPFQAWVKGGDVLNKPRQVWSAHWAQALPPMPSDQGDLLGMQSVATAHGPALKLRFAQGEWLLGADGKALPPVEAGAIEAFARTLYKGEGALSGVSRIEQVPTRLGLVRELGDKTDVWQAQFDDRFKTRLYFDGRSGEFLTVRNEAWVLYDFFWRLHLMDYRGGEDFNNSLLRAASAAALLLVSSGLALSAFALRRAWRRRNKAAI